jgi:hypothetical protein
MLESNVEHPCRITAQRKNLAGKRDVLECLPITGHCLKLATHVISTHLGQTVPGVLQGELSVEIMEIRVRILLEAQDAGTQRILVTVIPCQETACIFKNVTLKQSANLT